MQRVSKALRHPRWVKWGLAITALLLTGAERWPTGHWEGGPIRSLPGTAVDRAGAPSRLRLATFNIHSGVGEDHKWDVVRTAELLRGCDLVSLQEVRGSGPWWKCNADDIGERLGVRSLFSPTESWWWHPWFGNGVLTRTRIEHWECNPLPSGFREAYRQVVFLKVPFGSGALNVLVVHLGKNANRAKQFPIVADMFLRLPPPAVLMGDTNTRPWDPMMVELLAHPGIEDPVGKRMADPSADRVDFILVKGLHWRGAGLVDNMASDHPMIWVDVEAQ